MPYPQLLFVVVVFLFRNLRCVQSVIKEGDWESVQVNFEDARNKCSAHNNRRFYGNILSHTLLILLIISV
jgi:hypothetical protein